MRDLWRLPEALAAEMVERSSWGSSVGMTKQVQGEDPVTAEPVAEPETSDEAGAFTGNVKYGKSVTIKKAVLDEPEGTDPEPSIGLQDDGETEEDFTDKAPANLSPTITQILNGTVKWFSVDDLMTK